MIPEETITRIRESVDLVELVREQVPGLKRAGRNWRARCPFHQERTPSFNVNPEMGVYKCFGCGEGGDAFRFLMKTEGLTYPEAIHKLGQRIGITIQEDQNAPSSEESRERDQLYQVMEDAARFYQRTLLESPEAEEARKYLAKRGLDKQSLETFLIGFAPTSGFALRDAAMKKGMDSKLLEKAGLVRRKEGSTRTLDNFWGRILFPIWDTQGRIIAFGGRAMGDAMPKYINSPDTPLYEKSRHLYGLFQGLATVRKGRRLVILEGYMDVVVCHQFGFDLSAATLGTALTDAHVRLLRRYVDRVTLLFDPDAAGAAATVRGGELLMTAGITVDVVTLPDGKDPDELLVEQGAPALQAYLDKPVPYMDYRLAAALLKAPGGAPEAKLTIARELLPVIQSMPDPLLQDEHLTRLANALRVDKNALTQQMKAAKRTGRPFATGSGLQVQEPSPEKIAPAPRIEEEMLLTALLYPSEAAAQMLVTMEWTDARCRQVWTEIQPIVTNGQKPGPGMLTGLDPSTRSWFEGLAMQERDYGEPLSVLRDFMESARRQQQTLDWQQLKLEIDSMIEGRIPSDAQKIQRYNELSRHLKGSKPSLNAQEAPFHG
jgi:DNA primase